LAEKARATADALGMAALSHQLDELVAAELV
jgi:hypothetical protein